MTETEYAAAQQVSAALVRGAVFQSLALGFAYPSSDVFIQLKARWSALLNDSRSWPGDLRQPFQRTNSLLLSADRETLESEHVRLFGPAARCPLHETAYGDGGRLLGRSASLADIAGFYLAFELHPAPGDPHREDHIGLELEFMSLLALKEAYAIAEGWQEALEITRTTQRRFLQDHLGTWIDAFTAQLKLCEPHPFYAALGESLCAWVHSETMRLDASPIPVGALMTDPLMGEDSLQCPYAPSDP
ncbi:Chlorate reductase assembly chaperone protein [Candidatus Methylomirabilis lanthanidiphila]|uniref:Chlorate reductase assembly chaperone protein n=1 Tax=Candidatus Methylomirabilis lanthanidiphila TaxID=2211376 RepID=A0A564ZG12_9BACT|nr:molecular chaperone TorD family protein [Candidatus Methylomirabilis lanthanidiphila]VUZ84260.1 Chlorate reductase assembly chaperone protein [Candidatus Methylomirabilis lanthanidiphila]